MSYGYYEIGGVERGYMVDSTCDVEGCDKQINRGLSYLCYGCEKYFCMEHLTAAYNDKDEEIELESFAGVSNICCRQCEEEFTQKEY
jgi:uncharacterized protein YqkB